MAEEKNGFWRNFFDPGQWTLVNLLQAIGGIAGVIALFYTILSPIPLLTIGASATNVKFLNPS